MSREIVPARAAESPQSGLAKLEGKLLMAFAPAPAFDHRDGWSLGFTASEFEFERERGREPNRWDRTWADRLLEYGRKAREWVDCAPPLAQLEARRALLKAAHEGVPDRNASRALIGLLLDSFPAGRPPDFNRYADAILHDVVDLGFSPQILARACQTVRRTSRFLPAVAEVIAACDEAKGELHLKLRVATLHVRKAEGATAALALPEPEIAA